MKRTITIAVVVCVLAVAAGWLLMATPVSPTAFIRILDSAGNPIAGAVIQPDGLRPKKNGGHYLWTDRDPVKPLPVTTDSSGVARVPYPRFVTERLETGEISFEVDHPDYCSDRPFRVVDATPPANASLRTKAEYFLNYALALLTRKVSVHPDPVILQRGATVAVSGYIGSRESRVAELAPMTSACAWATPGFWKHAEDGALTTRKIPVGTNYFRLVHFGEGGSNYFSDFITLNAVIGETNRLDLELKPGTRVNGRVSDIVPRPVKRGRVVVEIVSDDADPAHNPPSWDVWSEIAPDGTFILESVPRGRLEIVGICDGFVSENGPSKRSTGQRTPQRFAINAGVENIVLRMELAAAVEVLVLNEGNQPLEGAEVWFWPNVLWNDWGSTLFAAGGYKSEDILKSARRPDWSSWNDSRKRFSAVSDRRGIALVGDLPEAPGNQSFSVTHALFEMPVHRDTSGQASRNGDVSIQSGKTNYITVKLQKTGKDFVTH